MDGANKYFYNVPNIFPAQFKTRTTRDVMSDVTFTRDPRLTSVGRNKKKNQRQGSSVDQYCMTKVGRRAPIQNSTNNIYSHFTIRISNLNLLPAGLRDGRCGAAGKPGRERGPMRQLLPVRLRGLRREQEYPG